jgi:hypothetical protein
MRVPGCDECGRLWQEYTDATFAFVKLDSQVKMAALGFWRHGGTLSCGLRGVNRCGFTFIWAPERFSFHPLVNSGSVNQRVGFQIKRGPRQTNPPCG